MRRTPHLMTINYLIYIVNRLLTLNTGDGPNGGSRGWIRGVIRSDGVGLAPAASPGRRWALRQVSEGDHTKKGGAMMAPCDEVLRVRP